MHIKYRLHISVYLNTSALIVLDEWRVWACGTYESPGYPRLPQVSLKQDAVLHEGCGRHLTITDGESGAQEDRKRSRLWNIDETVAFSAAAVKFIFQMFPRGKKWPLYAFGERRPSSALRSKGGGKKCCLTEINSNASIKDSSPSAGLRGYVVKPPRRPREMGQDGEQNELRLCEVNTKQPQRLLWSTRRS